MNICTHGKRFVFAYEQSAGFYLVIVNKNDQNYYENLASKFLLIVLLLTEPPNHSRNHLLQFFSVEDTDFIVLDADILFLLPQQS